ncbi:MAG: hypothetical protein WAK67_01905, partial [Xanthobacteraceae bacterium]
PHQWQMFGNTSGFCGVRHICNAREAGGEIGSHDLRAQNSRNLDASSRKRAADGSLIASIMSARRGS